LPFVERTPALISILCASFASINLFYSGTCAVASP
jgi:hypothetical protein